MASKGNMFKKAADKRGQEQIEMKEQMMGSTINDNRIVEIPIEKVLEDQDNEKIYSMIGIEALAESIKEYGIKEPIRAYKMPDADTYLIQSGHRRKRAAAMAKLKTVPVVVLEWVDDSDVRKRNLVDSNLFNRHKDPMTIARELDAYRSTFPGEKEKDIVEMMANHYGYSISTIRRHLYLLKLIPELQEKVQQPDLYSMAGILEGRSMTAEQQLEFNQMIDDFVKEKGINALTKEVIIRMARNMKRPEKTSTYTMQEMIGNFISKCKKYESQDEELYYHTLLETREEIEKLIEAYEKK